MTMTADKKSDPPPTKSTARAERQRVFAEEGARALAQFEDEAVAVRKNMARLRALRQAKEAEALRIQLSNPVAPKPTRKKKTSK